MQGLPATAISTLESHWTTLSATDSNSITTRSSIQENHRRSLVVVHFGVIFGDSPIVALSDVGNSRLLAVAAVIARDILANTAQEQAHVFRATMMLPTGCLMGVPCCAGAGSRGTDPWRHPTVPPSRGPSAGHQRPSRPYGLRSTNAIAGRAVVAFLQQLNLCKSLCKSVRKSLCKNVSTFFSATQRQPFDKGGTFI